VKVMEWQVAECGDWQGEDRKSRRVVAWQVVEGGVEGGVVKVMEWQVAECGNWQGEDRKSRKHGKWSRAEW
jgi:hypothetical protein